VRFLSIRQVAPFSANCVTDATSFRPAEMQSRLNTIFVSQMSKCRYFGCEKNSSMIATVPPSGLLCRREYEKREYEKSRFSNNRLYRFISKATEDYSHSYNGRRIGTGMRPVE